MNTKVKAFLLTAAIFALAILRGQVHATATLPGDSTIAGDWYLQPVLASDLVTGKTATIHFDPASNSFSGNTGCNQMRGKFLNSADSIHFDENIITTKMACVGYNEAAFLKNLLRVNRYSFKNGILIFYVDGQQIFSWSRKPPRLKKTGQA